jgi:hypothetical protein
MLVKMITNIAGPDLAASSGQVIDVDVKTGKELITGKYAVLAETTKGAVEVAAISPQETAVMNKAKAK